MTAKSDEDTVKEGFWPKLASTAARIPFAEQALAAYYCATDRATPIRAKATLFGALAYFILPVDMIPDVILGLGFSDDLAVLMTAYTLMRNHVTDAHREKARTVLEAVKRGAPLPGSQ